MENINETSHRKKGGFQTSCRKTGEGVVHHRTTIGDAGFSSSRMLHPTYIPSQAHKVMLPAGSLIQSTQGNSKAGSGNYPVHLPSTFWLTLPAWCSQVNCKEPTLRDFKRATRTKWASVEIRNFVGKQKMRYLLRKRNVFTLYCPDKNISIEHAFILLCDKNGLLQARMLFPSINIRAFRRRTDWPVIGPIKPQNDTVSFLKKIKNSKNASDPIFPSPLRLEELQDTPQNHTRGESRVPMWQSSLGTTQKTFLKFSKSSNSEPGT